MGEIGRALGGVPAYHEIIPIAPTRILASWTDRRPNVDLGARPMSQESIGAYIRAVDEQ